jgi:hypothetical protein
MEPTYDKIYQKLNEELPEMRFHLIKTRNDFSEDEIYITFTGKNQSEQEISYYLQLNEKNQIEVGELALDLIDEPVKIMMNAETGEIEETSPDYEDFDVPAIVEKAKDPNWEPTEEEIDSFINAPNGEHLFDLSPYEIDWQPFLKVASIAFDVLKERETK